MQSRGRVRVLPLVMLLAMPDAIPAYVFNRLQYHKLMMTSDDSLRSLSRKTMLTKGLSSRRTVVDSGATAGKLAAALFLTHPSAAQARIKGAAEIDAEAYFQDLLKGNPLTGGIEQSAIEIRPARVLDKEFATFLDKTTLKLLSETSGVSMEGVEREVAAFRQAVEPGFQRRAPFPTGDLSNERCFDCYSYADFRVAAKLLPNLRARATFVRQLGETVLGEIFEGLRAIDAKAVPRTYDAQKDGLEEALSGLSRILAYMKLKGFLKDFRVNADDYDRASWDEGFSLEVLVTVVEPATLGGNVQFTGEGFLFHPDYVAETLLAYLALCGVRNAKALQVRKTHFDEGHNVQSSMSMTI